MDYESGNAHQGMDPEVFEIPYDEVEKHSYSVFIQTPIGLKRVRARQVSTDANFIFVHDMLRQRRWIAINSIQRLDGIVYTCSKNGTAVALRPTVFLEGDDR